MWLSLERFIHSFKTGLACLIGFCLVKALHSYLLFDQWLIVTILVVMCAQLSVGSIYYKSLIRFIGTLIGSLLAAFAILYFGNNSFAFALTIALAGMVFSYFATAKQNYADAGTLGAVTTAIILINPNPTLLLTVERLFEISLGLLIAALISQFVLPIHARNHLRRTQAEALSLLGQFYRLAVAIPGTGLEEMTELDEKIVRSLATQRRLANEAKRELLGSRFQPSRFKQLMECEKKILRDIDFLYRLPRENQAEQFLANNRAWENFNQAVLEVFDKIVLQVEKHDSDSKAITVPSLSILQAEILQSPELPFGQALGFCLENILKQLMELVMVTR